jgi:hypothetical protein
VNAVAPGSGWGVVGYVYAPGAARQPWQDAELVPERFVTISGCLTDPLLTEKDFRPWHRERLNDPPEGIVEYAVLMTDGDRAELVERHAALAPSAAEWFPWSEPTQGTIKILGYDVIGIESWLSAVHSWLCHSYEAAALADLGVRIGGNGLFASFEHAEAVRRWICDRPDDQAPEPAFWTAVAIATLR